MRLKYDRTTLWLVSKAVGVTSSEGYLVIISSPHRIQISSIDAEYFCVCQSVGLCVFHEREQHGAQLQTPAVSH